MDEEKILEVKKPNKQYALNFFSKKAINKSRIHALNMYPHESVGLIVDDEYIPLENMHEDPENYFKIDPLVWLDYSENSVIQAVIHSHPNGEMFPSEMDMRQQITTGVPWGIIKTNGEQALDPVFWGDSLPIVPLIGRPFIHGVYDCYSCLRDTFRLGKEKLEEQAVTKHWPFDPIDLPEVPRDDCWWDSDKDFYKDMFKEIGWVEIPMEEMKPGDGFLIKIRSKKLNHAGLYIGNNLILQHLPGKSSTRQPFGIWGRGADMYLRYEGPGSETAIRE